MISLVILFIIDNKSESREPTAEYFSLSPQAGKQTSY